MQYVKINLICTYSVGVPRSSLFLCPAVTPWKTVLPTVGYNNPGVRLYKYDRNTTHVKVTTSCPFKNVKLANKKSGIISVNSTDLAKYKLVEKRSCLFAPLINC